MTGRKLPAAETLGLERRISDLVNAAYGLTPEEVKLTWQTAPPRMPVGATAFTGRTFLCREAVFRLGSGVNPWLQKCIKTPS